MGKYSKFNLPDWRGKLYRNEICFGKVAYNMPYHKKSWPKRSQKRRRNDAKNVLAYPVDLLSSIFKH